MMKISCFYNYFFAELFFEKFQPNRFINQNLSQAICNCSVYNACGEFIFFEGGAYYTAMLNILICSIGQTSLNNSIQRSEYKTQFYAIELCCIIRVAIEGEELAHLNERKLT